MLPLKISIFNEVRQHHEKAVILSNEQLNQMIFYNPSSIRLTFQGFLLLKNIFTVYSFELDTTLKSRHHIGMSKMSYPYYLTTKRLILFSEMDAMVIKLHGGIKGFLETCFIMDKQD